MRRLRSGCSIPSLTLSGVTHLVKQIEDYLRALQADGSQVIVEWNAEAYPVLSSLPQGLNDTRWNLSDALCPRKNGLDGSQLFVDNAASATADGGRFWRDDVSRPRTVKEALNALHSSVSTAVDSLRVELAALTPSGSASVGYRSFQGASGSQVTSSSEYLIGGLLFDRSLVSSSHAVTFEVLCGLYWGGVSASPTGEIYLYDMGTPGAIGAGRLVSTISTASISQGLNFTDRVAVTLTTATAPSTNQIYASERVYQIRSKVVGGGAGDLCQILWAGIVVRSA